MRRLVWRRLDAPGMEIVHLESHARASGTQIGPAYELRWMLDGERLDLDIVGDRRVSVALEDADFFDVAWSPFFNSLPVWRDGLLEPGPARDYVMRYVDVPDLTVTRSGQRYEPRGGGTVRFRSGSYVADIAFDADGVVVRYPDLFERVS